MKSHDLIIVSNRLPVSVSKQNGKLVFSPSAGGLATAMASVEAPDMIWIGWPGIAADELTAADRREIIKELARHRCYPVFLTKAQVTEFYDGYSNAAIWPLFHYFQHLTVHKASFFKAYQEVNQVFNRVAQHHAGASSTIWVHDYHLMLLPQLLRAAIPAATIGFFLHIPFPSYEIFRLLPNRADILNGLLGADLVGFHTYDYAQYFMQSVQRILGHDSTLSTITAGGRTTRTDVFPIGIDYTKFASAPKTPEVKVEIAKLQEHYRGQRIILSVDRLDYSKGITERLSAFETFLEKNPRQHKKLALIIIAVPSRTDVEAYQQLRLTIEQTVSRINGKYATVDWTPISYQFKNLPFPQLAALYAAADVTLVTPLRDGMNLVAKEYIATKQNRKGVLILSELTGAVNELPEALHVNPNDPPVVAAALERALKMPVAEQKQRLHIMQNRLSGYNVARWASDFLEQLRQAGQPHQSTRSGGMLTAETRSSLLKAFASAKHRLLLLDYDGTLAPFVSSPRPSKAAPSKHLMSTLLKLCNLPHTRIMIISGRPRSALDSWFSGLPVQLAAEHGAWVKATGHTWESRQPLTADWKTDLLPIMQRITERTPGSLLEEKSHALVWHYRTVLPELAFVRVSALQHDLQKLTAGTDIGLFNGRKILEVKPSSLHKGNVITEQLSRFEPDFILAAGDDYTDEDIFTALPSSAYTIKVGPGDTKARLRLSSVEQVHALLAALAAKAQR